MSRQRQRRLLNIKSTSGERVVIVPGMKVNRIQMFASGGFPHSQNYQQNMKLVTQKTRPGISARHFSPRRRQILTSKVDPRILKTKNV